MRLAIVSRSDEMHTTRRLLEAAGRRGHRVTVIPILHGVISLTEKPELFCHGSRVPAAEIDAVIPRIGTFFPDHALALLRHLEDAGCPSLNDAAGIEISRDKLRSLQRLHAAAVAVPHSVLVKDLGQIDAALDAVGGAPVVIKPILGAQGRRIVRGDSSESASTMIEALLLLSQDVLVQEYVAESAGSDLRALVLGRQVIAAVRRQAPPGRFRSNLHQGGKVREVELQEDLQRLAVRATEACHLRFAGVDILESGRGPLVVEVNASPGLEGIERATGLDLADRIVEHLESWKGTRG